MERIIAHFDLDAFFASVEQLDKPWLRGVPVVIGADPKGGQGRGVVSTASYEAREYGIRSAMPIREAWARSEAARRQGRMSAAFLSGRFRRYGELSRLVFSIARDYGDILEQTGVDEGYLDLSSAGTFNRAKVLMARLKRTVRKKSGLVISVDIAPNRMIAKMASDFGKPDGLVVVAPQEIEAFLEPLPVSDLRGVGKKTAAALRRRGIETVGDLRRHPWQELEEWFGSSGFDLYEKARGVDERPVSDEREDAKSVGAHETFDEDAHDFKFVIARMGDLCREVYDRAGDDRIIGFRTVVITVRFADFETLQRSLTVKEPMKALRELEVKALKLLLPFFDRKGNPRRKRIRLIGVRIEKLVR